MARRKAPARPDVGQVPAALLRFSAGDWPTPAGEPDGEMRGEGAACFYARRRWRHAQRRYANANGMTLAELWRAIAAPEGVAR